jgi:hypothetical protein
MDPQRLMAVIGVRLSQERCELLEEFYHRTILKVPVGQIRIKAPLISFSEGDFIRGEQDSCPRPR